MSVMQRKEFQKCKKAIRESHGCESAHVRSVFVKEIPLEQSKWDGMVQVFDLIGCEAAKRAYACSYQKDGETKTVIILRVPPVDSPESALKAAMATEAAD
jgi:hypothetical protein